MSKRSRSGRRAASLAAGVAAMLCAGLLSTTPASAASVEEIECFFEPGDVPGVDVFFPAQCRQVTSTSGVVTIVAQGQLPEGFTLERTHVGTIPCFGGTGRITATTSGQVVATCHFRP